MNINDRRGYIETKDVFDSYGKFKPGGQELLIKKATGYISYVRGENPYTFPFRVYPSPSKQKFTAINSGEEVDVLVLERRFN